MSEPNPSLRPAAEALKAEGNALFARAKYGAALDKYTEAITLVPDLAVLYVNRAMCYKKRSQEEQAAQDAARALELDANNMKAHYLLGSCTQSHDRAIVHLTKALEAAREHNDSIKDEIWHALARAKCAQWEEQSAARAASRKKLQGLLQGLHQGCPGSLQSGPASQLPGHIPGDKAANEQVSQLVAQLQGLIDQAAAHDTAREVPGTFICPLTMEVFREPVITPAGHSYERAALLEHLQKVGKFDPINRSVYVSEDRLVSNLHLRAAVQQYLDDHPWAWRECR